MAAKQATAVSTRFTISVFFKLRPHDNLSEIGANSGGTVKV